MQPFRKALLVQINYVFVNINPRVESMSCYKWNHTPGRATGRETYFFRMVPRAFAVVTCDCVYCIVWS